MLGVLDLGVMKHPRLKAPPASYEEDVMAGERASGEEVQGETKSGRDEIQSPPEDDRVVGSGATTEVPSEESEHGRREESCWSDGGLLRSGSDGSDGTASEVSPRSACYNKATSPAGE